MVKIREPEEKDLMHFTRYSIDFLHVTSSERLNNEEVRNRKYWAADQFLAKNPKQKLLVADMNGRMIGYVLGIIESHGEADVYGYIREVFVDEFYRREGIGTDLCDELVDWMYQQEAKTIQVSLRPHQNGVSEFIRHIGFSSVSTLYEYQPER
ncbi:GNAT family N-acetyltransferase [Halobacillus litoralis]|uniref:GNAT family N-acetyltransferase n=1 Tax=Halobacillus litoralis TaxID=45668 RepID=A0A845FEG4_9BACI|nr:MULTISPECIES: GNAT family N-acetyltransferase [Halobacillus]MEC3882366.1 GNAT family N-acetyltransferase [Halobacillus sp. HZG1]MYL72823.1 GNAT family N-acetyltransferase [Halobacillus litoralis]